MFIGLKPKEKFDGNEIIIHKKMTSHNNITGQLQDLGINILPDQLRQQFIPSDACFNWCLEQQVVHSNNLELWIMFFPFAAFIMLIGYFWSYELDSFKKYSTAFIYMARLFLILFFAAYILIIRLRIYY